MPEKKLDFTVGGMHCAACSARIERVVGALPGVARIAVNLPLGQATVDPAPDADPNALTPEIIQAVEHLGFSAVQRQSSGDPSSALERWEERRREEDIELAGRKRDLLPGLVDLAVADEGEAGKNQRLRACPALGKAAVDEQLVGALFRHQPPALSMSRPGVRICGRISGSLAPGAYQR